MIADCGLWIEKQRQLRGRGRFAVNPQSAIHNPQFF
jgi:hypothetical protein